MLLTSLKLSCRDAMVADRAEKRKTPPVILSSEAGGVLFYD